jgi:predicted dehydrogenase
MGSALSAVATRPRLGFLGVGWIGRSRLEAVARSGVAEVVATADPARPDALDTLEELLEHDLDGVVIATPSALHAEQAAAALDAGVAVFCQKPLGRTAEEARAVVAAARRADRLLGVDLCYRHTRAAGALREILPALEPIDAVELAFHNAYGPDRRWYYDAALAGGGCLLDLGTHLVDLALWLLEARVARVEGRLLRRGRGAVEDYAVARLDLDSGAVVSLACSWHLPAGRDCELRAVFYGRGGGAALRNVGGSFYDLVAERYDGTRTTMLVEPPDDWGGRAIGEWARRLAGGAGYDPAVENVVRVAEAIDATYRSAACEC